MDFPLATDELDGELSEEMRCRIKSELVPGERLLWAARGRPKPLRIGGGSVFLALVAVGLFTLSGSIFATTFGAFGVRPWNDGSPPVLALVTGGLGVLVVIGMATHWSGKRDEQARTARTLYALTDQRAILWLPVRHSEAMEVHSFERGRVDKIHRVEYPDGSGDVIFALSSATTYHDPELALEQLGFKGIAEVRRVEELTRRTLFAET